MKKTLLFINAIAFTVVSFGQCTDDYDWGDTDYGVSPDPELGETFSNAILNEPYSEVVYILVPDNASAIVEDQDFPVDSVLLTSITIVQGMNSFTPEEFGLSLSCNNGGTSTNPCTFIGGQSGCGVLSGVPLIDGDFNITLDANVHVTASLGGFDVPLEFPFNYEGYTITVETENNIEEIRRPLEAVRISPNPISIKGLIQLDAAQGGVAYFKIFNLLGEEKKKETITLGRGFNKIAIDASDLESGVYLYNIDFNGFKVTKRFIVNK
jgi:hypothetical protein